MKIILATGPRASGEIEMAGLPFLGIGYIAAYLETNGWKDVAIVDAHSDNLSIEQTTNKILSLNPDVVGFTATTHNRLKVISVIKLLKEIKSSLFIMAGGPHFSLTSIDALQVVPEIDCVVRGEGEITTKELLESWPDQEKLKNVLGITYRGNNGQIIFNNDRMFLNDWSDFPSPAWHLYDLDKYQKKIYGTNFRTIGVVSSRGCPNQCVFCCNAAFSRSVLRLRQPKKFVDEIEFLNQHYGFQGFNFWDDTLTIFKDHVMSICQEIIDRRMKIKWYARARVNTVDQEIIENMKKAGCIRISFGIESGSPRILKTIKKNILLDQARKVINLCSREGLITSLNFIVNLPTQTITDLGMTVDLIKEFNKITNISANYGFGLIYPGTAMEQFAKENKILDADFSWNSFCDFGKGKITGEDPSVPYMEWTGMELEKVKAFMVKNLVDDKDVLKKIWRKTKKIQSWSDIMNLIEVGINYFRV